MSALSNSFQEHAALLSVMSNERRLEILNVILDVEMSVNAINKYVDISQSALSQHLTKLRDAKLVKTRRDAQVIYYSVVDERVRAILELLELFAREKREKAA